MIIDYYLDDLMRYSKIKLFEKSKGSRATFKQVLKNMDPNPWNCYLEGKNGIKYIADSEFHYPGFWVRKDKFIGITQFNKVNSLQDNIEELCSIPAIYDDIKMLTLSKNADKRYLNFVELFLCKKTVNDEELYDLYFSGNRETIIPVIEDAKCIEEAETEKVYAFLPNIEIPQRYTESNLELLFYYTKLKSLKIVKKINPCVGEINSVFNELYYEKPFWDAEFLLAYWDEEDGADKYSLKHAVETAIYQKYIACFNKECMIGRANIETEECERCLNRKDLVVTALISTDKLLNNKYKLDYSEYSDFFSEGILDPEFKKSKYYL